jgi:hypothetical protein
MSPRLHAATPLADILEDQWDAQLFRGKNALAVQLGWTTYHTLRSRGSRAGYPDRTLVRDRILFVELKREKTGPTPDQIEWLDKLATAGGEVYLWRPSDLDEIAHILTGRRMFIGADSEGPLLMQQTTTAFERWQPRSLWIPGVGRADTTANEQQTLLTKGAA